MNLNLCGSISIYCQIWLCWGSRGGVVLLFAIHFEPRPEENGTAIPKRSQTDKRGRHFPGLIQSLQTNKIGNLIRQRQRPLFFPTMEEDFLPDIKSSVFHHYWQSIHCNSRDNSRTWCSYKRCGLELGIIFFLDYLKLNYSSKRIEQSGFYCMYFSEMNYCNAV